MNLKQIYQPINKELIQVEEELRQVMKTPVFQEGCTDGPKIIKYFLKIPGKRLRPALVLLSARVCIPGKLFFPLRNNLISLATAMELVHSASLIHDDIIDNDALRRGQKTLNKVFGNRSAVLAGDILYAQAFSLLVDLKVDNPQLKASLIQSICATTQKMCLGEIEELSWTGAGYGSYLRIIEQKTASLMSVCCQSSAQLVEAGSEKIKALGKFGFYFGLLYQLTDDYIDRNVSISRDILRKSIRKYTGLAKDTLKDLENSVGKRSLLSLVDFLKENEKSPS